MGKRLTSIRRGIRYQDLVAAEFLLDMINGSPNSPLSVRLEDRQGGSFDDVVVIYPDRVIWKQVKWAQHPGAEPLTIDSLAAEKRSKTSLIRKFAESYKEIVEGGKLCELDFITNRSPNPEFQQFLSGTTSRLKVRLNKSQRERLRTAWEQVTDLDNKQFKDFLSKLSFRVNSPDIVHREKELRRQLRLLGCPDSAFEKLMEAIWSWSQDSSKESLAQVDIENVLNQNASIPPNEFQLPPIRVDRRDAQQELCRRVDAVSSGYFVLLGSPGSGKSTLLNTLNNHDEVSLGRDAIVYNCFTGTSDSFLRTRARADNFAKFLAIKIREVYAISGLTINASAINIEALLAMASTTMSEGDKLVVVIDGLDYAKRFAPIGAESLFASLPPTLPPNVIVVASAQVKEQLPGHLQLLEPSRYLHVSPLDRSSIDTLLDGHHVFAKAGLTSNDREQLTYRVQAVTNGHALHVCYAARQLVDAIEEGRDLLDVISKMPACEGDIGQYYRTLFEVPSAALARDALSLMASCPFEISDAEIASTLSPSADSRDIEDALRDFRYLFHRIGGRYCFCHDSLRFFFERQLESNKLSSADQIKFLSGLENDPRIGDHMLHLVAESETSIFCAENIDCDWLSRQIAAGANPNLLDEGLQLLALAALKKCDWRRMTRWWALQACLDRTEIEGDLDESNLVDAWLSMNQISLVERYSFITAQFLSKRYPGPDLLDLLEHHNVDELAQRLRDRLLTQPAPPLDPSGIIDDFGTYVRHASLRMSPEELLPLLEARAKEQFESNANGIPMFRQQPSKVVAQYADSIIRQCLHAKDLDRAEQWLDLESLPLSDDEWAEHYLHLRLLCQDLAEHAENVKAAIDVVEDWAILVQIMEYGGFDREVGQAVGFFYLNPILKNDVNWRDHSHFISTSNALYNDVTICNRLGLDKRMGEIRTDVSSITSRVGRTFVRGLIELSAVMATQPDEWNRVLSEFIVSIRRLKSYRLTFDDIEAAQAFVCSISNMLGSIAIYTKKTSTEFEFGSILESNLIPALVEARINYEGGHLSLSDMLDNEGLCPEVASRLRSKVEGWFDENIEFKSGNFINLSTRFARAGEMDAARRTLVKGVRSAFTYGYHKDTTINGYVVAFELMVPHLGLRFKEAANFITQTIIVLSQLTDGRMLYYASSYFIGVICKHDLKYAAQLALNLWTNGGNLKPHWILLAAEDQDVDLQELKTVFAELAPSVELEFQDDDESGDSDNDSRPDFATSETAFPESRPELALKLQEAIETSSSGSGLYRLTSLIEAFLACGDMDPAMVVFEEFELSLRELLGPYPLPELTFSIEQLGGANQ